MDLFISAVEHPKKTCTKCGGSGPFHKNKNAPDGRAWQCVTCSAKEGKDAYKKNPRKYKTKALTYYRTNQEVVRKKRKAYGKARPEWTMWTAAKARAKKNGLLFNILPDDIKIPERCPLLGVPLSCSEGRHAPNSPTLDRRDSSMGYIRGNVWVISHRANTLKSDATLRELELLAQNLRRSFEESEETLYDPVAVH